MWVKVCGTTSLADAELAIRAGADALGFVFATSPRQVSAAQVHAITRLLPPRIERYGVFVEPSFEQVVETVDQAGLSGVQLHATSDPSLAPRLRAHFSAIAGHRRLGLLRVLHLPLASDHLEPGSPTDCAPALEAQLAELQADSSAGHAVDAVLLDARSASASGGTGLRFDWARTSGSFLRVAPHLRLIVAGGLSPDNVAEAIATLRPWGVDVVTGVEAAPGRKDPAKLKAFIVRARATARALEAPAVGRA